MSDEALNLIVACSENRVIAREGRQPWRIPEDLKYFHDKTEGKTVILGRITFEGWPRANQEGRRPIVVTARSAIGKGVATAPSVLQAVQIADEWKTSCFITGGQRVFEEAMRLQRPLRLFLTLVHAEVPGDRFFPEWRDGSWREVERIDRSDPHLPYSFLTYER